MNSQEKWNKCFAFFLAILPILDIYGFGIPGISIGKLSLIIILSAGILLGIFCKFPLFPKGFLLYFLYMLIVPQILALLSGGTYIGNIVYKSIGSIFFLLILGYGSRCINLNMFLKYYEKIVVVCSVFFIIQELAFYLFDVKIIGLIPQLPLTSMKPTAEQILLLRNLSRSASFFLEPAHFAQYISAFLILKLFSRREHFLNFSTIFITLIMILTRSGIGYIVLLLVWIIFFFSCLRNKERLLPATFTLLSMGLALFFAFRFGVINFNNDTLSRVGELSSKQASYSSGFIRVYRGYSLFAELPALEKIFGIGQGNVETYVNSHHLPEYKKLFFDAKDDLFLNGIQQNLVYGGIIGLCLFLFFLFKLFNRNTIIGKTLVLTVFTLSFMAMTYNDVSVLIMLTLATLQKKENECNPPLKKHIDNDTLR
jgi:hypothetical protein